LIFAKEMRSGAVLAPLFIFAFEAVREAAKRGSFRGLGLTTRSPVPSRTQRRKPQFRGGSVVGIRVRADPW
jgi:hypothetical protein